MTLAVYSALAHMQGMSLLDLHDVRVSQLLRQRGRDGGQGASS